MIKRYI